VVDAAVSLLQTAETLPVALPSPSPAPATPCVQDLPTHALEAVLRARGDLTSCDDLLARSTPTPTPAYAPPPPRLSLPQQCSCYEGWKGLRCSEPICPESCHMATRQGICVSPGVCQCMAGWSGAACDKPGCKDMCNDHGACLAGVPPVCSCGVGWTGPSCAEPVCPDDCSGRGECVAAGECACDAGWQGPSCAEPDCGPVERGQCVEAPSAVLSLSARDGNRTAVSLRSKACFAGWTGENCSEPICPGDCSGHGKCVAPGKCACNPGFAGLTCDVCKSGMCFATTPEWVEARGTNLSGVAVDAARGIG
jgi:hypothetical protein